MDIVLSLYYVSAALRDSWYIIFFPKGFNKVYSMKVLFHIIGWLALALFGLQCKESTMMIVKGEKSYFKAKYKGKITLNATETAIESIVPDGYLEVRENDKEFSATGNSKGDIVYHLDDHGRSLSQSSEEGRE